jgi:hypothetical protein
VTNIAAVPEEQVISDQHEMPSPVDVPGLVEIVGERDLLAASDRIGAKVAYQSVGWGPDRNVACNYSEFDKDAGVCRWRSVHWSRGRGVGELSDRFHDPVPGRRSAIVASEFGSSSSALLERLITIALEHQLRRAPNVDLGDHALKVDDRVR